MSDLRPPRTAEEEADQLAQALAASLVISRRSAAAARGQAALASASGHQAGQRPRYGPGPARASTWELVDEGPSSDDLAADAAAAGWTRVGELDAQAGAGRFYVIWLIPGSSLSGIVYCQEPNPYGRVVNAFPERRYYTNCGVKFCRASDLQQALDFYKREAAAFGAPSRPHLWKA